MAAHREANGRGTLEPTLRRGTDVPLPGAERHQLSFRRNERRHPAFRRSWRDDDWWGGTQVAFTTPNLPVDVIGVGDQLTLDPGGGNQEIFYILAVDGPGLVTIHGTALAGHPGESYEIRRAYTGPTGLQAWENARDGDLVLENRAEVGVAYNDGAAFTGAVAIDTLSSSATNYMYLAVAKRPRAQRPCGHRRTTRWFGWDQRKASSRVRIECAFARRRAGATSSPPEPWRPSSCACGARTS